jgi:TonB family protein
MKKIKALLSLLSVGLAFSFTIALQYTDAYYPGGRTAMEKYFIDSLRYPAAELATYKEEVIRVTFDVSEKGVAENPQLTSLMGGSAGFDEEVNRLIASMPTWEPATDKNGKPISSSYHSVVVRFILPDSINTDLPVQTDSTVYSFAEIMPEFKGGEKAFQTYLQWTIRYPQMEKEQGKDGTVYIYFEVAPNGKIERVMSKKGVSGAPGLANEGIRVISGMPRWNPGQMNGKPVRVSMTVPLRYTLQ